MANKHFGILFILQGLQNMWRRGFSHWGEEAWIFILLLCMTPHLATHIQADEATKTGCFLLAQSSDWWLIFHVDQVEPYIPTSSPFIFG